MSEGVNGPGRPCLIKRRQGPRGGNRRFVEVLARRQGRCARGAPSGIRVVDWRGRWGTSMRPSLRSLTLSFIRSSGRGKLVGWSCPRPAPFQGTTITISTYFPDDFQGPPTESKAGIARPPTDCKMHYISMQFVGLTVCGNAVLERDRGPGARIPWTPSGPQERVWNRKMPGPLDARLTLNPPP